MAFLFRPKSQSIKVHTLTALSNEKTWRTELVETEVKDFAFTRSASSCRTGYKKRTLAKTVYYMLIESSTVLDMYGGKR